VDTRSKGHLEGINPNRDGIMPANPAQALALDLLAISTDLVEADPVGEADMIATAPCRRLLGLLLREGVYLSPRRVHPTCARLLLAVVGPGHIRVVGRCRRMVRVRDWELVPVLRGGSVRRLLRMGMGMGMGRSSSRGVWVVGLVRVWDTVLRRVLGREWQGGSSSGRVVRLVLGGDLRRI
jgi:hypothetical protein